MEVSLLLFASGLLAGAMNAIAGGGSFVSFPVLLSTGMPPVTANASNTVALLPGSLAGAWQYRAYAGNLRGISLIKMILLTTIGGGAGALLLLYTPPSKFTIFIPWLLLISSLTFAFGRRLGNYIRKKQQINQATVITGQFLLGIYGGYFGGAVGIMMMAVWNIFGMTDIKQINANKNLLVAAANAVAAILFIIAGKIAWYETAILIVATVLGGYAGGYYSKRINAVLLRNIIIVFNFMITAMFFVNTYLLTTS
ncbi:sulfite exporter TauE/SafE family protein [Niabella yanshanensis]|uniref:Probable membrane transporter protein n=1 Tax=Niabella yanshanensis TaxID=577386 RepID=A0ABZ0WA97_9BACT|nr:sulfite exporter TauE/SafE family protein [Niabella yanshanensis]WQD38905.1 sulfite exporter TauE/SafE family protein [Niabella yanshanensis]